MIQESLNMSVLIILAGISAILTLAVVFTGAISMAKGGDFNKKYGNKLMQLRVGLQALTILLIILAVAV